MTCDVSVIVVSWERPAWLRRSLTALARHVARPFEVIVVSDRASAGIAEAVLGARLAGSAVMHRPNVSAARNLGFSRATAPIVAFIDDDAICQDGWLDNLAAAFDEPEVGIAAGFVQGPDGRRFQMKAAVTGRDGLTGPMPVCETGMSFLPPPDHGAIAAMGTNCAIRRDLLRRIGGFDERFPYFLDDADVTMRLADLGTVTAVVPQARVRHGLAAGPHRRSDRVPTTLHQIGASTALFQMLHLPAGEQDAAWHRARDAQRRRLVPHLVAGRIEPGDLHRLLGEFDAGGRQARGMLQVQQAG